MRPSKSFLTTLTLAMFAMVACDDDPVEPAVEAPTISYAQAAHVAAFFSTGTSGAATLDWGGETGTLSVVAAVTGATLETTTGEVSWDESLPLGVNTVQVVATNSAGADTVDVTIDNQFQGEFAGGYNFDPESTSEDFDIEMTFNADGTLTALDSGTDPAEGTWTRDGTTITAVYSYDGGTSFVTMEGDVTHDTSGADLVGFWYVGEEAVEGNEEGYQAVSLVPPAA